MRQLDQHFATVKFSTIQSGENEDKIIINLILCNHCKVDNGVRSFELLLMEDISYLKI